jgi:nucleoside-diphosphate-sugar epimerase
VFGLDVRPAGIEHPKFVFVEGDVTRDGLERAGREALECADVVAHLAFIVTEIKDKKRIYDVNVNGTRRLLDAVKRSGIRRLVVASSVSAYGSHPRMDPITEETPLDGNEHSYYSHTKHLVEGMVDDFEKENPGVAVTRLRPSILCGAHTDNFFLDLLPLRFLAYPNSNPEGLPLVHEDDAGRAFYLAIKNGVSGAFNIAAGNLSYAKIGEILDRRTAGVPYALLKPMLDFGFRIGMSPMSSHWLLLTRYPFHVNTDKAKRLLGWTPQRSPEEAFREMVAAWKKS